MKKLFTVMMILICSMIMSVSFLTSCAHNANKDADGIVSVDSIPVDSIPVDTLYEDTVLVDTVTLDNDEAESL